jgi:hypothetical protein
MRTVDEVQRKWFMSLAPVYLITSAYLMQAHLEQESAGQSSTLTLGLSAFTMAVSIWLVMVAFWTKLHPKVKDYTYQIAGSLSIFTPLVFILGWLGVLGKLIDLKAYPAYVSVYVVLGLLFYLAMLAFNVWNVSRREPRKEST